MCTIFGNGLELLISEGGNRWRWCWSRRVGRYRRGPNPFATDVRFGDGNRCGAVLEGRRCLFRGRLHQVDSLIERYVGKVMLKRSRLGLVFRSGVVVVVIRSSACSTAGVVSVSGGTYSTNKHMHSIFSRGWRGGLASDSKHMVLRKLQPRLVRLGS